MIEQLKAFENKYLELNPFYSSINKRDGSINDLSKAIESYVKRFCLLIDSRYADSAEIKRIVDSNNDSAFYFDIEGVDELYNLAKEIHEGRKKGSIIAPETIRQRT